MITVTDFEYEFEQEYPKVISLIRNAGLSVHEGVQKITLHGSRGPKGGFRDDSDLDLSLIVDTAQYPDIKHDAELAKEILYTSLANWHDKIKLDLNIVFDIRGCKLACFNEPQYAPGVCLAAGGIDCYGLYRIEDGAPDYVINAGTNIKSIYPCIVIWRNLRSAW